MCRKHEPAVAIAAASTAQTTSETRSCTAEAMESGTDMLLCYCERTICPCVYLHNQFYAENFHRERFVFANARLQRSIKVSKTHGQRTIPCFLVAPGKPSFEMRYSDVYGFWIERSHMVLLLLCTATRGFFGARSSVGLKPKYEFGCTLQLHF